MPDFGPKPESAVTPNRASTLTFDVSETVAKEAPWGGVRMYDQVATLAVPSKGADGKYSSAVHFWACGCWTIRPIQMDFARLEDAAPDLIYDVVIGG